MGISRGNKGRNMHPTYVMQLILKNSCCKPSINSGSCSLLRSLGHRAVRGLPGRGGVDVAEALLTSSHSLRCSYASSPDRKADQKVEETR